MKIFNEDNGCSSLLTKAGKKLLATTAMTAVGLLSVQGQAQADPAWSDFTDIHGSTTTDTISQVNTTLIDQHTDTYIGTSTNLDILGNQSVIIGQNDISSRFVAIANSPDSDPTRILGLLKTVKKDVNGDFTNQRGGELFVNDRNGVIFGVGSRVDAQSVIVSTADTILTTIDGDKTSHLFTNFGDSEIINHGEITVAEAGVAAFVSPNITNSGVINAKMATVAMGAGNTVTLDMYGDGLVEIAVNGELADGLIKNTGTINANGGNVKISAAIAKNAVEDVINMAGVVKVNSATVKSGKIILSGGAQGRVNVRGTLQASGGTTQDAGSVEITGERIRVADTAEIKANANAGLNAGDISLIADRTLIIDGELSAQGLAGTGFIETSAPIAIFRPTATILATREWLLDPTDVDIDAASVLEGLIESQLAVGDMTVQTPLAGVDEGNINVNTVIDWASDKTFKLIAEGDINLNGAGGINATGAGNFEASAGDDVQITGDITTQGGNVTLIAGTTASQDDINVDGDVNTNGGDFSATAGDDVRIRADLFTNGGNVTLTTLDNPGASEVSVTAAADIQTNGGDVTINSDGIRITEVAGTYIDAGTGTVFLNRVSDGTIGLGAAAGDTSLTQAELASISALNLTIGNAFATGIDVEGVDTTTATISDLVTLNAAGAGADINFTGVNVFNALQAEANDDILVTSGSSITTKTGGVSLKANNSSGGGNTVMQVEGTIDTTLAGAAGTVHLEANDYFVEIDPTGSVLTDGGKLTVTSNQGFDIDQNATVSLGTGGAHVNAPKVQLGADINTTGTITGTASVIDVENNTAEIQDGVDVAASGATVNVFAGTYAEDVAINKAITVKGAGKNQTSVTPGAGKNGFTIDGTINGEVKISKMEISGGSAGVRVNDTANLGKLTLNKLRIRDNDLHGVSVFGNSVQETTISKSEFLDNGAGGGSAGEGDILFYLHNGDITLKNIDIQNNTPTGTADYGIQIRGSNTLAQSGDLTFENVKVSGDYRATQIGIQEFTGLKSLSMSDVVLGGQTDAGTDSAGWGSLYFGSVGAGDFSIGNTSFNGGPAPLYQHIINDSPANFDATGATFEGIAAAALTVEESFGVEDKIFHKMDLATKGLVTWQTGNLFVTQASGSIQRGVDASDVGGNVWVDDGTFAESVNVYKTVNLYGNNHGVSAADGIRSAETLVTPNSPGFLITADDVVLDGFAINGADDGVRVSGTDRVKVRNNLITNSSDDGIEINDSDFAHVKGNKIDDAEDQGIFIKLSDDVTIENNDIQKAGVWGNLLSGPDNGMHGIFSADSDRVKILSNTITRSAQRGIWSVRSNDFTVSDNIIDDSGLQAIATFDTDKVKITGNTGTHSGGQGIAVVNVDDALIDNNIITTTTHDGILVARGSNPSNPANNIRVTNNKISHAGDNGIAAKITSNLTISNNEIDDVVNAGILVENSDNAQIISNEVNDNGASTYAKYGIRVEGGNSVDVDDNKIEETTIAGIAANNTTYIDIDDNLVKDGADGIRVEGGHRADIRRNETRDMSDDGIQVVSHNDVEIEDNNKVIRSGDSGITVSSSARAEIDGNNVDVAKNGIRVNGGSNAKITNNEVDDASDAGIRVTNNNDAQIISNEINDNGASTFAKYGILVEGGNSVDVDDNKIEETTIAGIAANNTTYIDIDDNLVKDGARGIAVDGGYNADIRRNTVQDMSDDGISVQDHNNVDVEDNTVRRADGNGIFVEDSNDAYIYKNTVDDSGENGIYLSNSDDSDILDNDVTDSGEHGIKVNPSDYVDIAHNTIDDSGYDGINVDRGFAADIWDNTITDSGYDAIDVHRNSFVDIWDNDIDGTGDNGIEVSDSFAAEIYDNDITDAGNDGINVDRSAGTQIYGNLIYGQATASVFSRRDQSIKGAGRDGIHVENSSNVVIDDNTIQGDSAFFRKDGIGAERHGIFVSGGDTRYLGNGVKVTNNNILGDSGRFHSADSVGDDGIHIEDNGAGRLGSDPIVSGNVIEKTGNDGIDVERTDSVQITDNRIHDAGDDGIEVEGGRYAYLYDNHIGRVGDDGIDIDGNRGVQIHENYIHNTGLDRRERDGNGIEVSDSFDADIVKNVIEAAGDDGIEVDDSAYTDIRRNEVSFSRGDAIDVDSSYAVDIVNNDIFVARENGVQLRDSDDARINRNNIHFVGENGIEVDDGHNIRIRNNHIGYAGDDGIDVDDNGRVRITGNTVHDTRDEGIQVTNAYGRRGTAVIIADNDVQHTDYGIGIWVENFSSSIIRDNRVRDTGEDGYGVGTGIEVRNGKSTEIHDNIVRRNGHDGIEVDSVYHVDIRRNLVRKSHEDGIFVGNFGHANIINNDVSRTGDDGIEAINGNSLRIARNDVNKAGAVNRGYFYDADGIHVENVNGPSDNRFNVRIVNNNVTNSADDGIEALGANRILVTRNTVDNSGDDGINVLRNGPLSINSAQTFSISLYPPRPSLAVIRNNVVTNSGTPFPEEGSRRKPRREPGGDGIEVGGFEKIRVIGNDVSDSVESGLFVSGGYNGEVEVSGNTFTDNDIGAHFQSGMIDLTGERNFFNGGRVGMRFAPIEMYETTFSTFAQEALPIEPSFAPLSLVDNTIGTQTFDGQEEFYVELDNGAFFDPGTPTLLNALDSTYVGTPFGTFTPSVDYAAGFPLDVLAFLESKFFHYNDDGSLGLFFFPLLPEIDQEDIFNYFGPNAGDLAGLNVTILGLPGIPGGTPVALNNITPAAGGDGATDPASLNAIETAAGGEETSCWGDAADKAGSGPVNLNYGGSAEDLLNGEASCGS